MNIEIEREAVTKDVNNNRIIGLDEIYKILPFGKKMVLSLIHAGELPVVKVGRTYITTENRLIQWIEENIGQELYY